MKDILIATLTLFGGLGIFLLGMKHLSEGLQATAGDGLRKFMGRATSSPIVCVGAGIVSTMIVQSSSIITVMLVGFVSSALMTLPQAFAVLIGANIGTTATIWIIAYAPDPQMIGFAGLAAGSVLYFFMRKERCRNIGLMTIGLGLVFMGLYCMSKGVAPVRENPAVASLFGSFSAETIPGAALVALCSALFTALIQSSAATIAIAMALAQQGVITYDVAIATLFGANIGTTATGWIAAIGGTADARRTALSHTLSNLAGSVVLIFFFPLFVKAGKAVFPDWNEAAMVAVDGRATKMFVHMTAPIAVTDTLFAVLRGLMFFPLIKPFSRLVERLVKQPENEKPHLSALKSGIKSSPIMACDQAMQELRFMAESDLDLVQRAREVIAGTSDEDSEKHIVHREEILDNVQREITEFLGAIMVKRLPYAVSARAQKLLRLADELESVSDECAAILKAVKRLRRDSQSISERSRANLLLAADAVAAFANDVTAAVVSEQPVRDIAAVQTRSREIHHLIRDCRRVQIGRVGPDDEGSSVRVLGELDILGAFDRMRSCYLNSAETVAGGKA